MGDAQRQAVLLREEARQRQGRKRLPWAWLRRPQVGRDR